MFTVPEAIGHIINIKLYVLDPMSVIVKLAILANKPIGTKIIIKHNAINVDENTFMQSMYRFLNGHTKSDLHYLYNPIQIACTQYLSYKTKSVSSARTSDLSARGMEGATGVSDNNVMEDSEKQSPTVVNESQYLSLLEDRLRTLRGNICIVQSLAKTNQRSIIMLRKRVEQNNAVQTIKSIVF